MPGAGGREDEDTRIQRVAQQGNEDRTGRLTPGRRVRRPEETADEQIARPEEAAEEEGGAGLGDVETREAEGGPGEEAQAAGDADDGEAGDGGALEGVELEGRRRRAGSGDGGRGEVSDGVDVLLVWRWVVGRGGRVEEGVLLGVQHGGGCISR